MKKHIQLIIFFTLFIIVNKANAKNKSIFDEYFEKAGNYSFEKNYSKAIEFYNYILVHNKDSSRYNEAVYEIAYCYYEIKDYQNAIKYYTLFFQIDSKPPLKNNYYSYCEQNGDSKHEAAYYLGLIYYKLSKYDLALDYLKKSDTLYYYYSWCGNGILENIYKKVTLYKDVYLKQNNPQKAFEVLIPYVLIDIIKQYSIVNLAKSVINLQKNKKQLVKLFNKSLDTIYSKLDTNTFIDEDGFQRSNISSINYIYFLQQNIILRQHLLKTITRINNREPFTYNYNSEKEICDKELVLKVKKSKFYKMLKSLK